MFEFFKEKKKEKKKNWDYLYFFDWQTEKKNHEEKHGGQRKGKGKRGEEKQRVWRQNMEENAEAFKSSTCFISCKIYYFFHIFIHFLPFLLFLSIYYSPKKKKAMNLKKISKKKNDIANSFDFKRRIIKN